MFHAFPSRPWWAPPTMGSRATGPPRPLACVAFYAAAAGRRLRASSVGCGGAAAAFARQDGDLRHASPAPRPMGPPRRRFAHGLGFAAASAQARQDGNLRPASVVSSCPSARHVGDLRTGFGFAALVYVRRPGPPGFAFSGTTVLMVVCRPGPAPAARAEPARTPSRMMISGLEIPQCTEQYRAGGNDLDVPVTCHW